jgi:hypothetical protein
LTVTGVVAQAVAAGLVAPTASRASVVSGVELAAVGDALGGVAVVVVGDEQPTQPPATASAVRTMSVFVPFMALASIDVAG